MSILFSQVTLVSKSMKAKIAEALVSKLETVRDLKYISFDRIKLLASDFNDTEIPAVQVYDVSSEHQHENSRSKYFWRLTLEILMKGNEWRQVSQTDLWNLEYQVKRALFVNPNLGVPGVIQLTLLGTSTDLHLLEPYYFARMDLEVQFYEDAVRPC